MGPAALWMKVCTEMHWEKVISCMMFFYWIRGALRVRNCGKDTINPGCLYVNHNENEWQRKPWAYLTRKSLSPLSLSLTEAYTHSHTPSLAHSLSHTHTHTLTRSLSHTQTHSPSLSCSLSLSYTHTHTPSLPLSITDTLSHTHTLPHSLSLSHTHSLTPSLSLSHTHSLTPSLSHTHTHTHWRWWRVSEIGAFDVERHYCDIPQACELNDLP